MSQEMDFNEFQQELTNHIAMTMLFNKSHIFQTDADPDVLYNLYLDSFPPGTNEIFRERREYDCNACRKFIRHFGTLVTLTPSVEGDEILKTSCWDFKPSDERFQAVVNALAYYIDTRRVVNVFITKESRFGEVQSVDNYEPIVWKHLNYTLQKKYVHSGSKSIGDVCGDLRTNKEVLERSIKEISYEAIETVQELIGTNALYKGVEWEEQLGILFDIKEEYVNMLTEEDSELFCWLKSLQYGPVISKIKNHSIGVLLIDLTSGMDLDVAVSRYEAIVAPKNYKRPKAVFSKKMIEQAEKTLVELELSDSLARRRARLDDISVNDILFAHKDAQKRLKGSVFDELKTEVKKKPKDYGKVTEISIDKFISDVLPSAKTVEILFEGRHIQNLVSIIAPANKDAKSILKWNNNFGWAYRGNITDSNTKELVKSRGGDVDVDLRFSIKWNDGCENYNDYDAHCLETIIKPPKTYEIYYRNRDKVSPNGGKLDVDIIHPEEGVPAVENIRYKRKSDMSAGTYKFFVNTFTNRCGDGGFSAEIEFNGEIHEFQCLRPKVNQEVATITLSKNEFSMNVATGIKSGSLSKKVWNIDTGSFVPVTLVMNSPNYWNGNDSVGHKHYMFMLANCVSDETPNGFFNEFLNQNLNEHRRVFEALGSKMKVQNVEDQLSGLGFSSTKRAEVICRVTGAISQTLKIQF